jgi:SAM-dependent methyltransferase
VFSTDEPAASSEDRFDREREFHDALAAQADPSSMPPREVGHESNFEDAILDVLGPLEGKRVLDLGCGEGDLSLRLLRRDAAVTGLDVSPGMVELARQRTVRFLPRAEAEFVAAPAEATGLDNDAFDLVVGKWVLHHTDIEAAAAEVARVLKPGGEAVFVETSALNPVFAWARKHLAGRRGIRHFGTPDEHPISKADIELLESRFRSCTVDFPLVMFFSMLDRHIFGERGGRVTRVLRRADGLIERRFPRFSRASYYLRIRLDAPT